MIEVPPLSERGPRMIAVCAHIDLMPGGEPFGDDEMIIAKLRDGENGICVRKVIDSDDDSCHVHIEAGFESAIGPFGEPGTPADVLELPPRISGTRQFVTAWARYRIERDSTTEDGLIRAVTAMAMPTRNAYQSSISGCTLRLSGAGPVKELRWWSASETSIGVEITIHCEMSLDNRLLMEAHRIIEGGLQTLM